MIAGLLTIKYIIILAYISNVDLEPSSPVLVSEVVRICMGTASGLKVLTMGTHKVKMTVQTVGRVPLVWLYLRLLKKFLNQKRRLSVSGYSGYHF